MKKQEVILKVKACLSDLGITRSEYIIVYGGAMVLRDIREECNDIDITLSPITFDRVVKQHNIIPEKYSEKEGHLYFNYNGDIDLFRGSNGMELDPEGTETDDRLIVQTLPSLRNEKYKRGRKKDKEDLVLIDTAIEDYIRRHHKYVIRKA